MTAKNHLAVASLQIPNQKLTQNVNQKPTQTACAPHNTTQKRQKLEWTLNQFVLTAAFCQQNY